MSSVKGRVLGVDLGLQRTGLALSDELRLTTRALPTLTPRSRKQDIDYLLAIAQEHDVRDVVIGLPLLPSGDDGPMTKRARGFAQALQDTLNEKGIAVVVHLRDERGSSKEASARLVESAVKKSARKGALDGEVARLLIESFASETGVLREHE